MADRTCSVSGCTVAVIAARGMCRNHYNAWWKENRGNLPPLPRVEGCAVDGCDREHQAHGYCKKHLARREVRDGEVVIRPSVYEMSAGDRILARVEKQENGCWNWLGSINYNGYGRASLSGERYAHRASYLIFVGPIPDGYDIDHLCRNRRCVNPEHLEPVTRAENLRRGKALITHCPQGHPYDEGNTYWRGNTRNCRQCNRDNQARRARRAAA